MKQLLVVVTLLFLAACGEIPQGATPQPTDVPLLTDEDFDNAQLLLPTEVEELVGIEGGEATAEQMLTVPRDAVLSQQNTPSGLPDQYSALYYIQADSTPKNAPDARGIAQAPTTYRIFQQFPVGGSRFLIYSGARETQSISQAHNGGTGPAYYVSMRETTDPKSDFEIFMIFVGIESTSVGRVTSDNVDNINVSGKWEKPSNAELLVYEETISGKATIVLWKLQQSGQVVKQSLSSPYPQRQPSISGDNKHIVFVRDMPNGYDSVVKYTIATNTYSVVVDTTPTNARTIASVNLDSPSIGYYSEELLWLENNTTVRYKNLFTGAMQTVASDPTIRRPHLHPYGGIMTYQPANSPGPAPHQ
jgi:hypothetical protein